MMSIENGCHYCKSCDTCNNKNCLVNKQKIEIERLTRDLELALDIKEAVSGLGTSTDRLLLENENLLKENAGLQKQVDELKIKTKLEKEWGDIKVAQALADFEIWKQEAVKNMAQEVFAELFYIASIHHSNVANILAWAKEKAKSVGIEVE